MPDCFCYSGGFALHALAGGARSVTAIDSSGSALAIARDNAHLNHLPDAEWIESDVFQMLRKFRDAGRRYDIIVLDPPKLAPTAAHAEKASRACKDANLLAFKLLNPGGVLMTYSCSGGVSAELFQKIVAGAALDAGVTARIEAWHHAASDHPVILNFPEGEYLKGLVCRIASAQPICDKTWFEVYVWFRTKLHLLIMANYTSALPSKAAIRPCPGSNFRYLKGGSRRRSCKDYTPGVSHAGRKTSFDFESPACCIAP